MALVAGCGSEQAATPVGGEGDAGSTSKESSTPATADDGGRPTRKELIAELPASDGVVVGSIGVGRGGVYVEAYMTFAEERHVVSITLEIGGEIDSDVDFYPESYDTGTGEDAPEEHDVAAGEAFTAQGEVAVSCAVEPYRSPPVLEVSFTRDGGEVEVERLEVVTLKADTTKLAQIEDVVRAYCDAGVQGFRESGSMSTDGDARVTYVVHNPGPDDVTVTSQAGSNANVRWREAGPVSVPAGESAQLKVEGKATKQNCGYAPPLELGLMESYGPDGSQTLTTEDLNSSIC